MSVRPALSRRRGFSLQAASRTANGLDAVTVARPSRWGNPFVIGRDGSHQACVARYREWIAEPAQAPLRKAAQETLRGKNLACWCAVGAACHGDVLIEVANGARAE